MELLRRADQALAAAERAVIAGLLGFMVALAFLQVVLRQLGSASLLWGDTLNRHLVLWVGFLGAALAASSDRQFAMDAAAQLFKGRAKARVALACHLFTVFVCAGLARASWAFLAQERAHPATLFVIGGWEARAWWFEAVAPLGFALLFVHYLFKTVEAAWAGLRPDGEAPEAGTRTPPLPEAHGGEA